MRIKQVCALLLYISVLFVQLSVILFSGKAYDNQVSFDSWSKARTKKGADNSILISHDHKTGEHKYAFRPNKRYHPESPILFGSDYRLPGNAIVYTGPIRIGHPTTYLLFSVILARTMRGPPAVA